MKATILLIVLIGLMFGSSYIVSVELYEESADLVNQERQKAGVDPLSVATDLAEVAQRHSQRMADDGSLYHNPNLRNELDDLGNGIGENVGVGPSVERVHQAFMESPDHRANILRSSWDSVGVGIVEQDDRMWVTQVFRDDRDEEVTVVAADRYNDHDQISPVHLEAVYALRDAGILVGDGNGNFNPRANLTRQQFASGLYRLIEILSEG